MNDVLFNSLVCGLEFWCKSQLCSFVCVYSWSVVNSGSVYFITSTTQLVSIEHSLASEISVLMHVMIVFRLFYSF